jgi:cellulose synthase/poly-beta-1,6-N-acetylglucosamine synthase-like glycosyltransferase
VTIVAIVFWVCAGLLIYTQVGYGLLLAVLSALPRRGVPARGPLAMEAEPPSVSVIVAAYAEQDVIAERVANLRAQDYPQDQLQLIVACDGSPDLTAARARAAGADLVLELPRRGKVSTQDAAVAQARGQVLAFSDANASWHPDALQRLVAVLATDPKVGYVCGDVAFVAGGGDNQEGLYWRYEMWLREMESRLASITAGNGAIYATRADAYLELGEIMSHDIAFPFSMVKRGRRAVYEPAARATEKMTPSIDGEFARKRRMASRAWPAVVQGGMLSPRGYSPMYALMIFSHRLLRYASPLLHLLALGTSIALVGHGWPYIVAAGVQVAVLLMAALAPLIPARMFLVARYYVATTASLALGFWDWARGVRAVTWEPVEGTR